MSKKIAICAGHGLATYGTNVYDPGAIGNGFQEYELVREIAKYAAEYLGSYDCTVDLINYNKDKSLNDRINYCNANGYDFVAEVHMNSFTSSTATGTEAYYNDQTGRKVADAVCKQLSSALGVVQRSNGVDDGGDKATTYFGIVCRTKMPAILIETCYISNPTDVSKVNTASKRKVAGEAIAKGIVTGLELKQKTGTAAAPVDEKVTKYYIQTGAFGQKSNADKMRVALAAKKFSTTVFKLDGKYLTCVGPYTTKKEAESARTLVINAGYAGSYVRAFKVKN